MKLGNFLFNYEKLMNKSPSSDDSLNLTSGSIFANRNNTIIGSHIGEKKESMGYISSLNKTGVTFPKSLRPSFAKIVE